MGHSEKSAKAIAKLLKSSENHAQSGLSENQLRGLLDALPANIALIDSNGEILLVNEAWKNFAQENGMSRQDSETGNYLQVCENAASQGDPVARQTLNGLKSVLSGEKSLFDLEYPCNSPIQERWFRLNVATVELWGDRCAVVTHSHLSRATDSGNSA